MCMAAWAASNKNRPSSINRRVRNSTRTGMLSSETMRVPARPASRCRSRTDARPGSPVAGSGAIRRFWREARLDTPLGEAGQSSSGDEAMDMALLPILVRLRPGIPFSGAFRGAASRGAPVFSGCPDQCLLPRLRRKVKPAPAQGARRAFCAAARASRVFRAGWRCMKNKALCSRCFGFPGTA